MTLHNVGLVEATTAWILTSLADVDFYKLTMLQLYFLKHRRVRGKYGFKNRTIKVPLGRKLDIDELRRQLEHGIDLWFTDREIDYLATVSTQRGGLFRPEFLEFLCTVRLSPIKVELSADGTQLVIETAEDGLIVEAMLWETLIMNVVNRMYFLDKMREEGKTEEDAWAEGDRRLTAKIAKLKAALARGIRVPFIDFGTRRRWSLAWQEHVLRRLMAEVPELLMGTSNVLLAMTLGIPVVGTMAHECDMAYQGIYRAEDDAAGRLVSHEILLDDWTEIYGDKLSIALSDTYGSEYFFRTFGADRATYWKGLRQDSGDVYGWGTRFLDFYRSFGIDPKTKSGVFSDGLDVDKMIALTERFGGLMNILFGWGTDLMNDMGFEPLSIVVKLIWCAGCWLVKLSDNLTKATGPADAVERITALAQYTNTASEECRV